MIVLSIRTKGIKKALSKFKPEEAIVEFIWNGFDAKAKNIDINYQKLGEFSNLAKIEIIDDGTGIPYEKLEEKFKPFYESEKDGSSNSNVLSVKGQNGYGRLTFFKFATKAKWETVYQKNGKYFFYEININASELNSFDASVPVETDRKITGTRVIFSNIRQEVFEGFIKTRLKEHVKDEFAWFLELYKLDGRKIRIQGEELKCDDLIVSSQPFDIEIKQKNNQYLFNCRYIQWAKKLNNEYSNFYFLNTQDELFYKKTTKLNNKGDNFYHSIFITSEIFNFFKNSDEPRKDLNSSIYKDSFWELEERLNSFLRKKRKPFLHESADRLISNYEANGIFPQFSNNSWDIYRKKDLESIVRELYEVEPKIFHSLNTFQKKTLVHLLNIILDSETRDDLFEVMGQIVELDDDELKIFGKILKTTKLNNIINTINLIQDRIVVIESLKELVFNKELGANEVNHLQKLVEDHYWIFGEKYNLVSAAEDKFEKALQSFHYLLTGESKKVGIDHIHRLREMDIFVVRQNPQNDIINNIVVELKHPNINLGEKELSQVKKYMSVIINQDQFNAKNYSWDFHLVGNKFNSFIEGEIENSKTHGERSLAYWNKSKDYKIFVKTWSTIINELELRHNFLNDKLLVQRELLTIGYDNPDGLLDGLNNNTARQSPKVVLPPKK